MKNYCLNIFFIVFLSLQTAQAQVGKATYIFTVDNNVSYNSTLQFNTEESLFILDLDNPIVPKNEDIQKAKGDSGPKTVNKQVINIDIKDGKPFFVYKNTTTRDIESRELIFNGDKAILQEKLETLKWVITPEKKKIAGIECQKATIFYRCANYTAWFAPSIPVPFGPWKLGGLPGLIFELVNENVNHSYLITSLDIPAQVTDDFKKNILSFKDKRMNYKEFAEKQQLEFKKMEIYLKGLAGSSDGRISAKIPECFN